MSTAGATLAASPYPLAFAPRHYQIAPKRCLLPRRHHEPADRSSPPPPRSPLGACLEHRVPHHRRPALPVSHNTARQPNVGGRVLRLVQVEGKTGALPALSKRAAYIAGSILIPYGLAKALPGIRARIRARLERNLARMTAQGPKNLQSWSYRFQSYVLMHLSSITSPAPVHAVSLALFYFSGSYYELAKRIAGLRYIFTRKVGESSDRAGYELLGVLLVIQFAVQGYLHVRSTLSNREGAQARERSVFGDANVSLDEHAYSSNNALLTALGTPGAPQTYLNIGTATHTPVLKEPRYNLEQEKTLGWIKGAQQRKCTLCLEELKDPSATQCGHVFCWECIGDWVREKPECPLCRRECLVQHILPLRAV
ncbi:hypothetical protein PG994_010599 [Apiospora phragmitis]|uniref:RING-type E3 ubiquitin transferase n=1 Tax=Apiospora phragmitis TaxID=2905665 RepID=A0ABR1TQD7_9PEZI